MRDPTAKSEPHYKWVVPQIISVWAALGQSAFILTILGELYYLFWFTVVAAVIATTILVTMILTRKSKSESALAPGITKTEPRFSRAAWTLSISMLALSVAAAGYLGARWHRWLFNSVFGSEVESVISAEPSFAQGHMRLEQHMEIVLPNEQVSAVQRLWPNEVSEPYTIRFKLSARKHRQEISVETLYVRVLKYEKLPKEVAVVFGHETVFEPVQVFAAFVPASATDNLPKRLDAHRPSGQSGTISLRGERPVYFEVNVTFQELGIYEIVPEIAYDDGWGTKTMLPLPSKRIACIQGERGRPQGFAPAPKPRDMPPPPKPAGEKVPDL